jgi:hypothetical protein
LTFDDHDGSMHQLAQGLFKRYSRLGKHVELIVCNTSQSLERLSDYVRKSLERLIIVGHSEFFESSCRFQAKVFHIIPLKKRKLGGAPLEAVSELICNILKRHRIGTIDFCCCEVATNTHYYDLDLGSESWEHPVSLTSEDNEVIAGKIREHDPDISSLEYICHRIFSTTLKCPTLQGLNGFGWIDPEKDELYKTFPSDHVHLLPERLRRKRTDAKLKSKSKIREIGDYEAAVLSKRSPHSLVYTLSPRSPISFSLIRKI